MDYPQILKKYINVLVHEGASDLHFSAGIHPTIRVSSNLMPMLKEPVLTPEDLEGFLRALISKERMEKFKVDQEIDFAYEGEEGSRFRGNAFYQRGTIAIALRVIPKKIRTIAELGLPETLISFARRAQGFFLVVGPVGQGKTTTLASLIEAINTERMEHIVTIEDPIEYLFETQTIPHRPARSRYRHQELRVGAQRRFPRRHRRDTCRRNARATRRCRLPLPPPRPATWSSLHSIPTMLRRPSTVSSMPFRPANKTRSASSSSSSLAGIFSQRLLPRISGGLIPACELLINNNAVGNLIRESRTKEIDVVIETSSTEGMIDFNHSLADLVARGEITAETAYQYSLNPTTLNKLI